MILPLILLALVAGCQSKSPISSCAHGYIIEKTCVCDWGWTGSQCDVDVDECLLHPCSSGSTCLNSEGSYECLCPEGRTGKLCEAASCSNDNECLNGGFCEDAECICQPAFAGPNCERNYTDPCASPDGSARCKPYEVCLRNGTEMRGFSCVCRPGFGGRFCDEPIDNYYGTSGSQRMNGNPKHHTMTDVNITVLVQPEYFVKKVDDFLLSLSQRLRTTVKIRKTEGKLDVFEWNSIHGEGERVRFGARNDARAEYSRRRKRSLEEMMSGVLVVLQIDLEECTERCFKDAYSVARYIAEMEAKEPLNPAMPIHVPLIARDDEDSPVLIIIVIVVLLAVFIALGVIIGNRKDVVIAPLWKVPTAQEAIAREEAERAAREMRNGGYHGLLDNNNVQNQEESSISQMRLDDQPAPLNRSPLTPLETAAMGCDSVSFEMRPLSCKLDSEQRTSLHLLALNSTKKSTEILNDCNLLIEFGMDVNAQDYYGNTALHYACRNVRSSFVERLLEAGADPTITNENDMTALHEAAQHFDDFSIEYILANSIYKDKAKLDAVDRKDRSALMLYAANCNHSTRGAELLIRTGADANFAGDRNVTYRKGRTALHHAAQFNSINRGMIEFLVSNNANKDAADDDGATPLWLAVSANNLMAVDELIRAGASVEIADNNDQTPEDLAIARGYTTIVERFKIAKSTRRSISSQPRFVKMPRSTNSLTSSNSTTPSPPTASGPSSFEPDQSVYSVGSSTQPSPPYDQNIFYLGHQSDCVVDTRQQFATYNPPACAYQNL